MAKRNPAHQKSLEEFNSADLLGLTEAVNYTRLHTGVQPTTDEAMKKRMKGEGIENGDADDMA